MRLNLGEIATILGCRPERIIWEPGIAGDAPKPVSETQAPNIRTLRELTQTRKADSRLEELLLAPWSGIVPSGAQVDSRRLLSGNIFFCLPGENTDGHEFGLEAAKAGASALVALRNPYLGREKEARDELLVLPPVFLVENVMTALWRLAICHRDTSIARVIGVTGSAGKTSVKEILAQVLAIRGFAERNPQNFNNQIGLPVSMLNADADASFWVMEAGISQAHDMDELAGILRPDVALILNVGDAHLAGLGEKGVAASKAVLLDYIQPGGMAVVSQDYPDLNAELEKRRAGLERRAVQVVRFSLDGGDQACVARYLGPGYELTGCYEVCLQGECVEVEAPFRGDFGRENVAAVYAVAHTLGLSDEEIIRGLVCAVGPEQRFSSRRLGGFIVIDDSYNANPLSMERMLDAARTMAEENELPLILVLGEMLELGDRADQAHEALGRQAAEGVPLCIFWKGGQGRAVLRGLQKSGYKGDFYMVDGGQDFSLLLEELKPVRGVVLFKASRGNHLERLVDVFRENVISAGECDAL